MKTEAFRSWLFHEYHKADGGSLDERTVSSRVANCETIERHEGDLDLHFDRDQLRGLLERLTYSKDDKRQSQRARHRIPIQGDVYNGTATYRSAASLYKQFRGKWIEGAPIRQPTANGDAIPRITRGGKSRQGGLWPTWDQPSPDVILAMARATVPFVRFLDPEIIQAIVDDNEKHQATWREALEARAIKPEIYLWDKSPCAFPGVRRYAGSHEIAAYRRHVRLDENQKLNALALDDNDYPKHLWSFVFQGRGFSKTGPKGYALAHLADHKDHGNRFARDFVVTEGGNDARHLFGLYTCPSNTVYAPLSLIKPTDFEGTVRALLVRRAQQLYGAFCNLLPPFLRIPETCSPEWNVSEFGWADPVGTMKHIPTFLEFRRGRMGKLINGSGD